jgi:hypothetical protein
VSVSEEAVGCQEGMPLLALHSPATSPPFNHAPATTTCATIAPRRKMRDPKIQDLVRAGVKWSNNPNVNFWG